MTGISKATFSHCEVDAKLAILFDLAIHQNLKTNEIWEHLKTQCPSQIAQCNQRLTAIEKSIDKCNHNGGSEGANKKQVVGASAGGGAVIVALYTLMQYFGFIK